MRFLSERSPHIRRYDRSPISVFQIAKHGKTARAIRAISYHIKNSRKPNKWFVGISFYSKRNRFQSVSCFSMLGYTQNYARREISSGRCPLLIHSKIASNRLRRFSALIYALNYARRTISSGRCPQREVNFTR